MNTKKQYVDKLLKIDRYLYTQNNINYQMFRDDLIKRYYNLSKGTLRSKLAWKKKLATINGYNLKNL